jgi:hypothetical protein
VACRRMCRTSGPHFYIFLLHSDSSWIDGSAWFTAIRRDRAAVVACKLSTARDRFGGVAFVAKSIFLVLSTALLMQKESNTMESSTRAKPISRKMFWVGRAISGAIVLFMVFDGLMKLLQVPEVAKAQAQLGWPEGQGISLGFIVLVCTAVYVIPRTSVLGAILLTGYLGGATAAQARIGSPNFFFSVVMGVLVWAGLFFRDHRLRALIPLKQRRA